MAAQLRQCGACGGCRHQRPDRRRRNDPSSSAPPTEVGDANQPFGYRWRWWCRRGKPDGMEEGKRCKARRQGAPVAAGTARRTTTGFGCNSGEEDRVELRRRPQGSGRKSVWRETTGLQPVCSRISTASTVAEARHGVLASFASAAVEAGTEESRPFQLTIPTSSRCLAGHPEYSKLWVLEDVRTRPLFSHSLLSLCLRVRCTENEARLRGPPECSMEATF